MGLKLMSVRAAYLDYQASTPLDPRVRDAMFDAYGAIGNASSEEHAFGWSQAHRVADARTNVGNLLGVSPDEVTFTSGATEANNIAVIGAALAAPPSRRRIIISAIEHKSVSEAAYACEQYGYSVDRVPIGRDGLVSRSDLLERLGPDVAVVSIMAVNNEIGTIQPTAGLGRAVREAGAFYHVDATQAVAAIDIDLADWNADALSLSAHKIYGPSGIGALAVSADSPWWPRPLFYGGGQENGLRPGTLPTPLCVGFGEACRLMREIGRTEREAVRQTRNSLRLALTRVAPKLSVTCEGTERHPGCLHVRVPGVSASDLLMRLQPEVAASSGSACTTGILGPSHVLLALGYSEEESSECLRFSVGRFTTGEDVEFTAEKWASALVRIAEA